MKAVLFEKFNETPKIVNVDIPNPSDFGVVIRVEATGICRSDWHGWVGHDPDITLPHVPGHEFSGIIEEVGKHVTKWKKGDAVAVPFISGCGQCSECHSGNQQVCPDQTQPGFTHWGSFAEYVTIEQADLNLVALPENISFATAAALGCRFATSYRGIVDQGKVLPGQWVAVHGCGGVGLSAIMIAKACGANVIAVDIDDQKLEFARKIGAVHVINATKTDNVAAEIIEYTKGGVELSMDALGSKITCANSINNLRKRGRHVQVGLMAGSDADPQINMAKVIGDELELVGSHGMQAHRYPDMLSMIDKGILQPDLLVGEQIQIDQSIKVLTEMDQFQSLGATVITRFD